MSMYEVILDILDKKGPTSIPFICQEMNQLPFYQHEKEKSVQPEQVKTAINRKKDLFKVVDDLVSIDPEKDIQLLTVNISRGSGPAVTIRVDFVKKRFTVFEWNFDLISGPINRTQKPRTLGKIETFKSELYRMKLWEWEPDYEPDGIILDGICWSTKLVTKGAVFESEGLHHFPKQWTKFYQGLTKITGIEIL